MRYKYSLCVNDSCSPPKAGLNRDDALTMRYVPIAPRRFALKRRMRRFVKVTVPGLFLSLAACGGNVEPNIQLNPDPSMRYEVTVTVDDPSFKVDQFEAKANYKVNNEACVPLQALSGVRIAPIKTLRLDAWKVGDLTYRFVVYADALRDDDYFGQGTCHWILEAATFVGHLEGRDISASLFANDMLAGNPTVRFYPKTWMTAAAGAFAESGVPHPDVYSDRSNVFSIRIDAREVRQ